MDVQIPQPRGLRIKAPRARRGQAHTDPTGRYLDDILPDGAWKGQRCFVVGGGPSLRGFNWEQLRGELVIGTNRTFEHFDPCINASVDTRFLRWLQNGELGQESIRAFRAMLGTKAWFLEYKPASPFPDDVRFIRRTNEDRFSPSMAHGFGKLNNSGIFGLNIAVALGASQICLLGFDMRGNASTGKQDWHHSGYPSKQKATVYHDKFIPMFEKHAGAIKATGAQVVNLNQASGLRCFDFGYLQLLPPKPERPLVVCYYTKDTGYEVEARKMISSAHRMGLECDVRGIDTRGGWQANTYYKATFIRRMMDEYPNRPLLWLDADVEVRRYPAIFDNLTADLAVNIVDWSNYVSISRQDKELNTSVVYVRPNDRTRALFDVWIEANKHRQSSGVWEQKVFQDVLEGHKGTVSLEYLPDTYCQIFDLMKSAGLPVIELHQASRKLKAEVGA